MDYLHVSGTLTNSSSAIEVILTLYVISLPRALTAIKSGVVDLLSASSEPR